MENWVDNRFIIIKYQFINAIGSWHSTIFFFFDLYSEVFSNAIIARLTFFFWKIINVPSQYSALTHFPPLELSNLILLY